MPRKGQSKSKRYEVPLQDYLGCCGCLVFMSEERRWCVLMCWRFLHVSSPCKRDFEDAKGLHPSFRRIAILNGDARCSSKPARWQCGVYITDARNRHEIPEEQLAGCAMSLVISENQLAHPLVLAFFFVFFIFFFVFFFFFFLRRCPNQSEEITSLPTLSFTTAKNRPKPQ